MELREVWTFRSRNPPFNYVVRPKTAIQGDEKREDTRAPAHPAQLERDLWAPLILWLSLPVGTNLCETPGAGGEDDLGAR